MRRVLERIQNHKKQLAIRDLQQRQLAEVEQAASAHLSPEQQQEKLDDAIDTALENDTSIDFEEVFPKPFYSATDSPAQQVRKLQLHGLTAQREYVLYSLHRCLMRGLNSTEIAQLFDVAVPTITRWKKVLYEHYAKNIDQCQFNILAGEVLMNWQTLQTEASKIAFDDSDGSDYTNNDKKIKISALRFISDIQHKKVNFLDKSKFFDHNKFVGGKKTNKHQEEAEYIVTMVKDTIKDSFDVDYVEELSPTKENKINANLPEDYKDFVEKK